MRKLLLGTTALAAAATLSTNAALADVSISGAHEWTYNSRSSQVAANDGTTFGQDSSVTITFSNKTDSEMIIRAREVIKRVDLKDVDHKFPSEISGGMKKRVAIARAIVLNPKYLFCDEPNSGLDPKTAIIIDKLIQEITVEYDITTIINTHDMNSVMEIGDKIIFLVEGKKIWEGNNEEILNTDDKLINDFVYSSELFKKVKLSQKK